MTQKPTRFSHISVCVSDMDRSVRFYTEVFDFKLQLSVEALPPMHILTELPDIKARANFFQVDGSVIELLHYERPTAIGSKDRRPMNQLGITHLSFVVADLKTVAERIEKFGGQVQRQTLVSSPHGDMMFGTDPDGVRLELWQKVE